MLSGVSAGLCDDPKSRTTGSSTFKKRLGDSVFQPGFSLLNNSLADPCPPALQGAVLQLNSICACSRPRESCWKALLVTSLLDGPYCKAQVGACPALHRH